MSTRHLQLGVKCTRIYAIFAMIMEHMTTFWPDKLKEGSTCVDKQ